MTWEDARGYQKRGGSKDQVCQGGVLERAGTVSSLDWSEHKQVGLKGGAPAYQDPEDHTMVCLCLTLRPAGRQRRLCSDSQSEGPRRQWYGGETGKERRGRHLREEDTMEWKVLGATGQWD